MRLESLANRIVKSGSAARAKLLENVSVYVGYRDANVRGVD